MKAIPENIPRSLRSYLEQYRQDPATATERLENHLKKRGPDAVGHYLLSLFYYYSGHRREAVQHAWKAKIFAPGSPAMEQLHYYMSHPDGFNAWKPADPAGRSCADSGVEKSIHPISDLDALIDKLSSVESKRIKLTMDGEKGPDLSRESANVEDIVTETLAGIHEKQQSYTAAIDTYRRLMQINPDKKAYYKKQILRLQEKDRENQKEKE
ncbi:MAG: hypothetical protein WEC12_06065 [Balneolaceae bacterium]